MTTTSATTTERVQVAGLQVGRPLYDLVTNEALPASPVDADAFWSGFAAILRDFTPENQALLERREHLQATLDDWHRAHRGEPHNAGAYRELLAQIGYLVPEGEPFEIATDRLDPEIAELAGPQLVVPVSNARYAINAANARWGSLYDAVYGTDVLGDHPPPGDYDRARGERVIAWCRSFLDDVVPLEGVSHSDVTAYRVEGGRLVVDLDGGRSAGPADPSLFAAYEGAPDSPESLLLRHHGLGIELVVDRGDDVGSTDRAGVADVRLESAVTTIMDCEDSIAAVDAADKATAYRHWLGLVRGDLVTPVTKDGETFTRRLADHRVMTASDGGEVVVRARSLMLVRNVGPLMTTPAVLDAEGEEVFEGLLDAVVTVLCATADRDRPEVERNSPAGSVYVVKPKLHGPDEVAFTERLFARVEDLLGLPRDTVKIGIMDEERRTSANLLACIRAARTRVAFINTGFLDRTGDEIHTGMEAGPVVRKGAMKAQPWMRAYEERNVAIGLRCGLRGRAQIGKGMWAAPGRMAAMLEEKQAHPEAGATCAWVPSPTAATLHATHYHRVDVAARQAELADREPPPLADLLTLPVADPQRWSSDEIRAELENNAQGILGYVVRWVDQGIGCSTVPDIHDVGLMEDRATCRISSQHIANWLHHGVVAAEQVEQTLRRMAEVVDGQNADDPYYRPMAPDFDGLAFAAAHDLVIPGPRAAIGLHRADPARPPPRGEASLTGAAP